MPNLIQDPVIRPRDVRNEFGMTDQKGMLQRSGQVELAKDQLYDRR